MLVHRLRPYPVAVLAHWTLFVWGNRLWLAWTDDSQQVSQKVTSTAFLAVFVGFALATLWLLARRSPGDRPASGDRIVAAFARFTWLFWAVRLPMILWADHPGPFKVVHTALALISVGLALAAWRAVGRPSARPRPSDHEQAGAVSRG